MAQPTRSAEFHDGARYERKAVRSYLRRRMNDGNVTTWGEMVAWLLAREKRYAKRAGGL